MNKQPLKRKWSMKKIILVIVSLCSFLVLSFAVHLSHQQGFVSLFPFVSSTMVYVNEDGELAHGMQKIGKDYYYFSKETGFMKKGFQTINHKTYYFDKNGKRVTGLHTVNGKTYYFEKDGQMLKKKFKAYTKDEKPMLSYFDQKGHMVTGTKTIHKKKYVFDQSGNLQIDIEKLQNDVQEILSQYSGDISVYFKDLRTRKGFEIHPESMYPCCMIKTVALAAVFQEIDAGTIDYAQYEQWIEPMITISDNTSYNVLMEVIGDGNGLYALHKANVLAQQIGMRNTALHHGLQPGQHFFTDGGANVSCANDIGIFFEKLYDHELGSKKSCDQMIDLFKRCTDYTALQSGLGQNVEFAHKTGCADTYYHDGDIVYLPGRDYILVVFSKDVNVYTSLMYEISSCVFEYQDTLI